MYLVPKRYSALALTLAVTGLVAGCSPDANELPAKNTNSGGASGIGGAGPGPDPAACNGAPNLLRAPMRRLSRFEYNNIMRDLLQDTSRPSDAFPPEVIGNGFGNDADQQGVGAELANQYMLVSETVAAAATTPARIGALAACAAQITPASDAAAETACVRTIAETFTPKAYRRPLVAGEADSLVALFQVIRATSDFATSVATMLEGVLQSPEFIYKPEFGVPLAGRTDVLQPTGHELATRLASLFWASTPDAPLLAAAAAGELSGAAGVRAQAERLLADPRAREVVAYFFDKVLPISDLRSLKRDAVMFPTFNPKVGSLLRQETQTFLEHQIFSGAAGAGTWPSVFTAGYTFLNEELAAFYGVAGVTGEEFRQVNLDTTKRTGLLTQAGILAGPVHANNSNPVLRGSFVVQKLLCQTIPFPTGEIAAMVKLPDEASAPTARGRYTAHSTVPVCNSCHQLLDPAGFALENFDVVGQWRAQENGETIDVSGSLPLVGAPFNGAVELGQRLAASETAQNCFASHWINFGYGRTVTANEACTVESIQTKFKQADYNVQKLLVELTQSAAFLYLPTVRE